LQTFNSQKGGTSETVGTVDTSSKLAASEKTRDGLAVAVVDGGVGSDLQTTHGVVKNGSLTMSRVPPVLFKSLTMSATW
jgi:hypothetical protein